jgi:hypothetical protein
MCDINTWPKEKSILSSERVLYKDYARVVAKKE